jgi:hypothetical protein
MNKIREIKLVLRDSSGRYDVEVMKEYAPINGGGWKMFKHDAPDLKSAIQIAAALVSLSPDKNERSEQR